MDFYTLAKSADFPLSVVTVWWVVTPWILVVRQNVINQLVRGDVHKSFGLTLSYITSGHKKIMIVSIDTIQSCFTKNIAIIMINYCT